MHGHTGFGAGAAPAFGGLGASGAGACMFLLSRGIRYVNRLCVCIYIYIHTHIHVDIHTFGGLGQLEQVRVCVCICLHPEYKCGCLFLSIYILPDAK
jgi:hypothetical protein